MDLEKKLSIAIMALENIEKYKFRSPGPAGCDSHGIQHPCGPCNDLPNEKWVARKALELIKSNNKRQHESNSIFEY